MPPSCLLKVRIQDVSLDCCVRMAVPPHEFQAWCQVHSPTILRILEFRYCLISRWSRNYQFSDLLKVT